MKVANNSCKVKGRHEKRSAKRNKKRSHFQHFPPLNSDPRSKIPGTALDKQFREAASRGEPSIKTLKQSARAVHPSHAHGLQTSKSKIKAGAFLHSHTNGGWESESSPLCQPDLDSFAQAVPQNGMEGSDTKNSEAESTDMEAKEILYRAIRDQTHSRTVLVMKHGKTLCFRGRCRLTCLYGRLEVLGFTIEEGQQPYSVFSPPSHCPLTITATGNASAASKTRKERRLEVKAIIRQHLSTEVCKRLQAEVDPDSCLVLLEPLDTPLTRFLTSLPKHGGLFGLSPSEQKVQSAAHDCPLSEVGVIPLRGSREGLMMSQSYRNALSSLVTACTEELSGCPVIIVCGAKNVGKSTFNRHLINTLLNHTVSVDYLECDLGQTEFTPPGCLSLSTVTEPLLGVPFTHQHTPGHMVFFGESSCEGDLDRYLDSLTFLWRFYSRESPIVINTMGWVKGFGLQLLVDLIRLFSVTHVVQLNCRVTTQCPALTSAYLQSAHGWRTHPPAPPTVGEESEEYAAPRSHVLLSVQSEFKGAGNSSNMLCRRSNVLRDLAVLAYFSQLQSPEPGPVRPLHCFTPYQVPLSSVAMRVTHREVAPAHTLYAANAGLVALCRLGDRVAGTAGPVLLSHTPVCPCLGFGVLRGVDTARGLYFLVTPVPPSVLRQVNCLMLGGVTLPHTLLRVQPGIQGKRPYVTSDYSFDLTGAGKMRVFKGLQRREHLSWGRGVL